jgi:hypothetical protein
MTTKDSLDPEGVMYTVKKYALSKTIDGGPPKVLSELSLPPRDVALMILNDCYCDVDYEPLIDRLAKSWIRHDGQIEITANEVHRWMRKYWEIES